MTIEIDVTGHPGPKKQCHIAFDSANAFYECALRCAEPVIDPFNPASKVAPASPTIANIAFASELYIKALIIARGDKVPKVHRLDKLYNSLPKPQRQKIRKRYAQIAGVGALTLRQHLVELSNAFEDWRYIFEHTRHVRLDRLFALARALYDVVRDEKPEWTVTKYLDGRIKAGPKEGILSTTNLGGGFMVQTRIV
ncbi:HEPN domain-containing protein [Porphyrobacter sp. CACIAM 03H1]|uniref:HEPN domain-containing protein n=1 Tax=Porphyrobacter sp. CACIAM 03H1 TaxID=2003315 RepID=UPI0012FD1A72|nr:HEPN domain-containing protein [Porphyrobacter sp. CACIAM 03H1]